VQEVHLGGSLLAETTVELEHHQEEKRGEDLDLHLSVTVLCSAPDHHFDDHHQLVLAVDFDNALEVQIEEMTAEMTEEMIEEMIEEMTVYLLDQALQIGDVDHPHHLQEELLEILLDDPLHQFIQNASTLHKLQLEIRDHVHHLSESAPLQPNLPIEKEILLGQHLENARLLVL